TSTNYNIQATFADVAQSSQQVRLMLQRLLEDRFGLMVRRERRAVQGYRLVVARSDGSLGPNLTHVDEDCAQYPAELAGRRAPQALQQGGPAKCAMLAGNSMIRAFEQPLAPVVSQLENLVGAPVTDMTGLTGNFDLNLRWQGPGGRDSAIPQ